MTSSTSAGSKPARSVIPRSTTAARSTGFTGASPPFSRPTGLRTAPTLTASRILPTVRRAAIVVTMSPLQWRVRPVLPIAKLLGAVALVVLVVAFGRDDPVQWIIAIAIGAVLTGWAARDLLVPVRLS